MADTRARVGPRRPKVLVLARSFPSTLLPNNGLWTFRPMAALADKCFVRVVSPVPYCPPLPEWGPLQQYARFRRIAAADIRGGMEVRYPRFLVGPGTSTYALEPRSEYHGIRRIVDEVWSDEPFDLIHASFIYPDGAVAHRLSERYGVPFLVTELAPWLPNWLERAGVARQALPAARAASSILALSTHVRETIRAYEPSANVRVVPPGVDGAEFPLQTSPRNADQILFVGFLNYNKGVDVLLRAIAVLRDRDAPASLVLVGGSHYRKTRQQEEELRALATDLGLDGRVTFVGKQPPAEVARLMGESALVVLPSRAEAFGSVLAEALACGTPVVASRSGGPEDIVTDEVGALVPVDDHVALADAIARVLANRSRYAPERMRAYSLSHFGMPTVVEKILEAYEAALERTAPADQPTLSGEAA
jgi:glycosyltransferase involved in cell wall biosynthesis